MFNKYSHINDLTLLRKPQKRIIPQGPDLSNFITGNVNLKKLANFGLEMMKFLPKFEQLIYAGKMHGDDVTFTHHSSGGEETLNFSKEWWDAFNEFEITDENSNGSIVDELTKYGLVNKDGDGSIDDMLSDLNGDGKITNADTILWHENDHRDEDGFRQWRQTWIAGQHHRTDRFGPFGSEDGSGFAGGGMGARFKNIDFVAEANEWNHIGKKNNPEDKIHDSLVEDQAFFVNDILSRAEKNWNDVKRLLDTKFSGQSFYEIVMSRSYKTANNGQELTPEQAFLLVAAMYESRERAWAAMTEAFGPVTLTRNDKAMIDWLDKNSLAVKTNSYVNSHELALFPLFFYIQHSFQNQVTMFYEKNKGDGYNLSALDGERFWEFTNWAKGQLQMFKDSIDKLSISDDEKTQRKGAIQDLIDGWFGATDDQNKPRWEGYKDVTSGESWVGVNVNTVWGNVVEVKEPEVTSASYGWDRKWHGEPLVVRISGQENSISLSPHHQDYMQNWIRIFNAAFGNQSYLNLRWSGDVHPNYGPPQLFGMNFNEVVSGYDYMHNWMVHAVGAYFKKGEGMDIVHVMEKCAKRRVAAAEFKKDMRDYLERKEELEQQKAEEEKVAAKAEAKAREERKRQAQKAEAKRSSQTSSQATSKSSSWGGPARTDEEKKAFQKALQKLNQRILGASSKRKAWLQKTRQENQ